MRDFFERQRLAQRKTWQLMVYFLLAVGLIVAMVTIVCYVLLSFSIQRLNSAATPFNLTPSQWDPLVMAQIAGVVSLLILSGTVYKYLRLQSGGGSMIAEMLGGRIIYPASNEFHERRILNIVEEMALASGVTVPSVYVMEREHGINAFAAGFSQEDAVLGVTRGALKYLTREELQGVVAHEFSHILYGDMLINVRLQGILHGILVLGLLGEFMLKSSLFYDDSSIRSKASHSGGVYFAVIGLIMLCCGYTGVFVAKLIKSALSRQREFLADASAVQFTRNPSGLAGALKKIGGLQEGSLIRNPHASEISHMYFGNGLSKSWLSAFSTHPPLLERIRRLDPEFRGNFPQEVKYIDATEEEAMMYASAGGRGAPAHKGVSSSEADAATINRHIFIDSMVGSQDMREVLLSPSAEHMRMARELIESLPGSIRRGVRNGFGSRAIIYGLLLDDKATVRQKQFVALEQHADPKVYAELQRLLAKIDGLLPEHRLPLVDLSMPALKNLSKNQYASFRKVIKHLMDADQKIDLFEYSLQHVLIKHLDAHFGKPRENIVPITSLSRLRDDISCVLSLLARLDRTDEETARKSLMRAARVFEKEMKYISFLPTKFCSLKYFDASLRKLESAGMDIKRKVLDACLECIVYDDQVTVREAEIFRVIADALNCPAPPWLTLRDQKIQ
ncbi:MAG: M48 family metallopeptidase [Proteobacteria bacterium]|nr:M48 family metallopeptidase [Pseudomonadota bacterium]MBU1710366.1 M48 family metallopeptidase [Pseudomonadota bacterium]